jgi:hypothetical protein
MSKSYVSLKKVPFTRCVAPFGGEDKRRTCFAKTCRMLFHNKFFYLWTSKGTHDIFVLIINFLGVDWQPKYIIIGLIEALVKLHNKFLQET